MLEPSMPKINKKSKYQSLLINKKRYYFYKITWLDIVGDSGHATSEEFMKLTPAVMISYGYIFSKDKNYIRSFASYDSKEEAFSDRNVYPTGCVIKLEKISKPNLLKQLRDKAWTKYAKDCVFGLDWPRGLKPWLMTRSSQPQRRATLTKKQALSQKKELKKNTSYLLCGLMAFNAILSRRISAQLQ